MKNRYYFLKRLYKDYVIVFKKKNYYLYGKDKFIRYLKKNTIINTLENLHINYIIVDNLDIKIKKFNDNKYYLYLYRTILIEVLRRGL